MTTDEKKAYAAAWYLANRERVLAEKAAARAADPDRFRRQYQSRLLAAGRSKSNAYAAKYRANNLEKVRAARRAWVKANPDASRAAKGRRRALLATSTGSYTAADIASLMTRQNRKCVICLAPLKAGYHADHRMPLSLGGSNDRRNIQLLCPTCNVRKHAKHPVEFAQSIGMLL